MTFKSKQEIFIRCQNKYRINCLLLDFLLLSFGTLVVIVRSHGIKNFFVVSLFVVIVLYYFISMLKANKKGFYLLSRLINIIDINGNQITVTTFDSSFYFNLSNYDAIEKTVNRELLQFRPSDANYGFDSKGKFTKRIFILTYDGDEYLLAEEFFEEFNRIRSALGISG